MKTTKTTALTLVKKPMKNQNNKEKVLDFLKHGTLGALKFASRAVFYLPARGEHVAIRSLKVAALLHSAYESFKPKEDDDKNVASNSDAGEPVG